MKAQFLIDNSNLYTFQLNTRVTDKKGKSYGIFHLEDVKWSQMNEYDNNIFIVNLDVLEKLQINNLILKGLARELNKKNNIFYDLAGKNFLEIRY